MERAAGIEPAPKAWKAFVIPFHHARNVRTPNLARDRRQGRVFFAPAAASERQFEPFVPKHWNQKINPAAARLCTLNCRNLWLHSRHVHGNVHQDFEARRESTRFRPGRFPDEPRTPRLISTAPGPRSRNMRFIFVADATLMERSHVCFPIAAHLPHLRPSPAPRRRPLPVVQDTGDPKPDPQCLARQRPAPRARHASLPAWR